MGALARHLASAVPRDVRDWVGDRWPGGAPLPVAVLEALPASGAPDAPDALGLAHEALAGAQERRRGVHYTPTSLARRLAEVALDQVALDPVGRHGRGDRRVPRRGGAPGGGATTPDPPTVCDPACGGGAFLLAAARALTDRGHDSGAVVAALSGLDLDPLAARVAATGLVLWAGTAAREPTVVPGDALAGSDWPGRPGAGFDLVLGNPPFQAQLGLDTARTATEAARLREALGEPATGYVDTAALFLLAAVAQVRTGGVVLLIQPQSVLGSRDGAGVRARLAEVAPLEGLWVCDEPVFAARTRVCAPLLRREGTLDRDPERSVGADPAGGGAVVRASSQGDRPGAGGSVELDVRSPQVGPGSRSGAPVDHDPPGDRPGVQRWRGPAVTPAPAVRERPAAGTDPSSWAPLAAGLRDVPAVVLRGAPLAEAAAASAGFRDQFYGLAPHVREATGAPGERPLVTSGLLDLARSAWGERPARFAKTRWAAPVVDLDTLDAADPTLARWVHDRLVPKVVVATQTRVIEAAADAEGRWVPSTPVLAVPVAPERLWHLLAALLAPPASAWALHETAGTALAPDALKLSAAQLRRLPGPVDTVAWDEGATAAHAAQTADTAAARQDALEVLGRAMVAAHGLRGAEAEDLRRWWRARWPREPGPRADIATPAR